MEHPLEGKSDGQARFADRQTGLRHLRPDQPGLVRHLPVGGKPLGSHGRDHIAIQLRALHGRYCALRNMRRQVPVVLSHNLPTGTGPAYVQAVAEGPLREPGELLRAWLEAMQKTVPRQSKRQVALRVGLPVSTVNKLLNKKRGEVDIGNLWKMAAHMGVSVGYLVECIDSTTPIRVIERPADATREPMKRLRSRAQ